jgi:DNA-binding MarR family transcriptional regulator
VSSAPDEETALLASELRDVLGQIVRRLRTRHRFPLAQTQVLGRLDRSGAMGVSDLAGAEGVRPQSMAQTVGDLEQAGMVSRRPDPSDGRRQLVELTAPGLAALRADRSDREGWMARVLASKLTAAERATVAESVRLLQRVMEDPGE